MRIFCLSKDIECHTGFLNPFLRISQLKMMTYNYNYLLFFIIELGEPRQKS